LCECPRALWGDTKTQGIQETMISGTGEKATWRGYFIRPSSSGGLERRLGLTLGPGVGLKKVVAAGPVFVTAQCLRASPAAGVALSGPWDSGIHNDEGGTMRPQVSQEGAGRNHPSEAVLVRFMKGELPSREAALVVRHLL